MTLEPVSTRGHARRAAQTEAPLRRIAKLMAVVVTGAGLVAGCGGSGKQPSSAGLRQWSASTVVRLAGLRRAPDLSYHLSAHPQCATLVLLLSTAEVASYKGPGDAIVTNPDRSAGADVTTGSPSCRGLFKQAFSHVR